MKYILTEEARKAAKELQEQKRNALRPYTPGAVLARLRALLSDVTPEQAERDRAFLESDNATDTTRDNEKD